MLGTSTVLYKSIHAKDLPNRQENHNPLTVRQLVGLCPDRGKEIGELISYFRAGVPSDSSRDACDLPPKNWSSYYVRVRIKERGERMARRSYRPDEIIKRLREAEVLLSQGSSVGEAARKIGVTEQTYYRWLKRIRWYED